MPISACTSSICFLSKISLRMCFSRHVSMSDLISPKELSSLSRSGSFSKNFLFQRVIRLSGSVSSPIKVGSSVQEPQTLYPKRAKAAHPVR